MINGAHVIINSTNSEADRAFLRDVLGLPHVDAGRGWLIFGLPPAEVAVHPAEANDEHQFYLMCEDVKALVRDMKKREVACEEIRDLGWGLLTQVTLPGGGRLGIYQPRHARPKPMKTRAGAAPKRKKAAKSAVAKTKKRIPSGGRSRKR